MDGGGAAGESVRPDAGDEPQGELPAHHQAGQHHLISLRAPDLLAAMSSKHRGSWVDFVVHMSPAPPIVGYRVFGRFAVAAATR